ncbi:hypothetical protein HDV04_004701 [Boothiomyces sp. JEL0838]|nr:hypothetical protein HDV04_004701 [Boothiomyces sp. JEL0838]
MQMQVLKAFCPMSKILTPKILDKMMYAEIVIYFVTMFGYLVYLGNLGQPNPSDIINMWQLWGPASFAILSALFETWHAYFMNQKLVKFQNLSSNLALDISRGAIEASGLLKIVVVADIIMSYIGLFLYVISEMTLTGTTQIALASIGATIGESHCLTITLIFKLVRDMNRKSSQALDLTANQTTNATVTITNTTEIIYKEREKPKLFILS